MQLGDIRCSVKCVRLKFLLRQDEQNAYYAVMQATFIPCRYSSKYLSVAAD